MLFYGVTKKFEKLSKLDIAEKIGKICTAGGDAISPSDSRIGL